MNCEEKIISKKHMWQLILTILTCLQSISELSKAKGLDVWVADSESMVMNSVLLERGGGIKWPSSSPLSQVSLEALFYRVLLGCSKTLYTFMVWLSLH